MFTTALHTMTNYEIDQQEERKVVEQALFTAQTAMVQLAQSCWQDGDNIPTGTVDQQWIDEHLTILVEMRNSLLECQAAGESIQQTTIAR